MFWTVWERFAPLCIMAMLIFGTQAFTRRSQHTRLKGEARRLRSALTIGLQALRSLYERNLLVLAGGKPVLISGRQQINLLRPLLGRLISLDQPEIEAVIAASIAVEGVETSMAIAGKPVRGVAFTIPEDDEARGMLTSELKHACSLIETAEARIGPRVMSRDQASSEGLTSRNHSAVEVRGYAEKYDSL